LQKTTITYIITLFLLSILPINGTNSALNNNYLLSIRWDYLAHVLVYIPLYPLLILRNTKLSSLNYRKLNIQNWNLKLLIISVVVGMSLEAVQFIISWRTFNINDLGANILGVVLGVCVWIVFQYRYNNKIVNR
jgi:VanZ family protein